MEPKFMISEVLGTSWKYTKSQIWVLAGLFIGYLILSGIINLLSMPLQASFVGKILAILIGGAVSSTFMLGYVKNMFQTLDGEDPQFSAYSNSLRKIVNYFVCNIIYGFAVAVGLVLLLVPGIYLAIRLQFYSQFLVEEDCGIMEALKKSWQLTAGQTMPLFLLTLTVIGLAIAGCILLFIGLFVAIPLSFMMQCYVFRKLNAENIYKIEY